MRHAGANRPTGAVEVPSRALSALSTWRRSEQGATAQVAALLSCVTGLTALGNLFVHVLVARGGGVYTYGAVGALLSLGVIASTLAAGVQYAVARLAALSTASPLDLLRRGMWAASPWLVAGLVACLFAVPIASYLHLSGAGPVLLAFTYCWTQIAFAIPAGILIGRRRLLAFGALALGGSLLRVGYGYLLGWTSPDGLGALASSALAVATATAIGVLLLPRARIRTPAAPGTRPIRGRLSLAGEGVVGSLLSAALWGAWSLPLLFARHYLPASQSGTFAAAQLIVSTILLVSSALATAYYPAIVRSRARGQIVVGLAGTVGLSIACTVAAAVIGPTLIRHLYGSGFVVSSVLLLVLGVSVSAVAAATFALWAAQAMQRLVAVAAIGILSALAFEAVLGLFAHDSLALAASPSISCGVGLLASCAYVSVGTRRETRRSSFRPGGRHALSVSAPSDQAVELLSHTAVGIMAHNEESTIEACLQAILGVEAAPHPARVVVVASGCTDRTEEIVEGIAQVDPRVTLLAEPARSGKATAINWFLKATEEPICVLAGADTLMARGALALLVEPFADDSVGMTGGRVVPTNRRSGVVGRSVHAMWELHHHVALKRPKLGEVIAFRRIFEAIDADSLTDEVTIERLILVAGYTLRYVPDAVIFNHGPVTIDDYLAHRNRIHQGHLAVSRSSGYRPSTMDQRTLFSSLTSFALRRPRSIPGLFTATLFEVIARFEARKALELEQTRRDGVWRPIASAKRSFDVHYEDGPSSTPEHAVDDGATQLETSRH